MALLESQKKLMDSSQAGVGSNICSSMYLLCQPMSHFQSFYISLYYRSANGCLHCCIKPVVYFQHENDSPLFGEGLIFFSPEDPAKPCTITVNVHVCLAGVSKTATTQKIKPITPMGSDTAQEIRSESRQRYFHIDLCWRH